jgi:hypothetical protein
MKEREGLETTIQNSGVVHYVLNHKQAKVLVWIEMSCSGKQHSTLCSKITLEILLEHSKQL